VPWVIYCKNNIGLIQCNHLDKDKTINLLHTIKWIAKDKNNVKIQTLGTAGTIRSARKKYLDKLILYPSNSIKMKRV
jgi:RNase P/RNase MRP subunit POP5